MMGKSMESRLSYSNNLPLSVLQDDKFAVDLLSRVSTDDVCRIDGVKLHLACFDE